MLFIKLNMTSNSKIKNQFTDSCILHPFGIQIVFVEKSSYWKE
ncbi:hypothetical protein M153_1970003965 [Pseudoloma neurophilia]|uniref:Uncharacterized protein n=1 Tax=Pseudoloma neurophilia TaxID=146866 RepID=A0A0R0LZC8_9MICR|nr:hypothetical protein M153_1970003965 [Pseudoloma neurophilia]